jgi:hypothetical protein
VTGANHHPLTRYWIVAYAMARTIAGSVAGEVLNTKVKGAVE